MWNVWEAKGLNWLGYCLAAVTLVTFMLPANAANRALLVGIGEYRNPEANLSGIDLDIEAMERVAEYMGFKPDEIKVLENHQATAKGIEAGIQEWLVNGVKSGDRALFYYSGHGTNIPDLNNDEPDDVDEVLVAYDVEGYRLPDGRPSLRNVVVDDRFNQLLKAIPSSNVLVLIDACNSGTATKALNLGTKAIQYRTLGGNVGTRAKSYTYPGMPMGGKGFGEMATDRKGGDNFIAVSAAQDDEYAQATPQGSLFTLAIEHRVAHAKEKDANVTASDLLEFSRAFIRKAVEELPHLSMSDLFKPALSGNMNLANKPLIYRPDNSGATGQGGPIWRKLEELSKKGQAFKLAMNKTTYKLDDLITLSINLPSQVQGYYLNILTVDSRDQGNILYPNQFAPGNNRVSGKTFEFPKNAGDFEFFAMPPTGKAMIVALLTKEPLNLYQKAGGSLDSNKSYVMDDVFARVSAATIANAKAAGVRQRSSSDFYTAKVEFVTE